MHAWLTAADLHWIEPENPKRQSRLNVENGAGNPHGHTYIHRRRRFGSLLGWIDAAGQGREETTGGPRAQVQS
jgi:hypothetical protein